MGSEWPIYAFALALLAVVWAIVFAVPALLVHFKIISTAHPVVDDRRPVMRDWLLTALNLAMTIVLVYWDSPPDVVVLVLVFTYFIAGPWWIWRSVKSILYFQQHRNELSSQRIINLFFTNFFFYSTIGWGLDSIGLL